MVMKKSSLFVLISVLLVLMAGCGYLGKVVTSTPAPPVQNQPTAPVPTTTSSTGALLPPLPTDPGQEKGDVLVETRTGSSLDLLGENVGGYPLPNTDQFKKEGLKVIYDKSISLGDNISGNCGQIQAGSQKPTYITFQEKDWHIEIWNRVNNDELPIDAAKWVINYFNKYKMPDFDANSGEIAINFTPKEYLSVGATPEWGCVIFFKKSGTTYYLSGPLLKAFQKATSIAQ